MAKGYFIKGQLLISGRMGDHIYKIVNDQQVILPYTPSRKRTPSSREKLQRELFRRAVAYAKTVMQNPALQEPYLKKLKKGETLRQKAIQDFLSNPGLFLGNDV